MQARPAGQLEKRQVVIAQDQLAAPIFVCIDRRCSFFGCRCDMKPERLESRACSLSSDVQCAFLRVNFSPGRPIEEVQSRIDNLIRYNWIDRRTCLEHN